jgi:hypothetical protein
MKKIKFKGKVVVCVRRKNGKWEKWKEEKGIVGFPIITFSEFPLFPSFPFSHFLHKLHLSEVIHDLINPKLRANGPRGTRPTPH